MPQASPRAKTSHTGPWDSNDSLALSRSQRSDHSGCISFTIIRSLRLQFPTRQFTVLPPSALPDGSVCHTIVLQNTETPPTMQVMTLGRIVDLAGQVIGASGPPDVAGYTDN